jgi:hypothetical protein
MASSLFSSFSLHYSTNEPGCGRQVVAGHPTRCSFSVTGSDISVTGSDMRWDIVKFQKSYTVLKKEDGKPRKSTGASEMAE